MLISIFSCLDVVLRLVARSCTFFFFFFKNYESMKHFTTSYMQVGQASRHY